MGKVLPLNTKVETKQGEVLITLNLNLSINLTTDGIAKMNEEENEDIVTMPKFELPKFQDNEVEIIDFGKNV